MVYFKFTAVIGALSCRKKSGRLRVQGLQQTGHEKPVGLHKLVDMFHTSSNFLPANLAILQERLKIIH
jgi:hypothetical protein